MSGFQYGQSGLNNATEYVVSGLPFSKQINFTTAVARVDFPFVTSEIYIKNRGAGPLAVGWTANGVSGISGDYKHTLLQNEAVTFRVRVKSVFLLGVSGSGPADVTAAMTMIKKRNYPEASGSYASVADGGFGYNSGSNEFAWGWEGIG